MYATQQPLVESEGFAPECVCCFGDHPKLFPVLKTEWFVHPACAEQSEDFGICPYCAFDNIEVAYRLEDMTPAGECPNHADESVPDGPDLEDILENIQKDNPFDA